VLVLTEGRRREATRAEIVRSHAKEDIRIYQTRINWHLVPVLVNPFSRNDLWKWRDFVRELREGI
jgi:hypothetical protein